MFATIDINPLRTLLADKHFYLVCCHRMSEIAC